jgi:hypothetical protein
MSNFNSSDLTKKLQTRVIYADYLAKKQKFESGCASRITLSSGSAADNSSSLLINIIEGPLFTTPTEQAAILQNNQCPIQSVPVRVTGGSLRFAAGGQLIQTNVSYPNDTDLAIGTGSFTVEWFQYYQDSDANAIVFSIGTFGAGDGNELSVTYVGTQLYLFTDGSSSTVAGAVTKNVWQHVAVVGNGAADGSRNVKVYVNGELKLTRTVNYDITQTSSALRIGNQTNATVANGNYAGLLTNFRWVKGTQVYTTTFTPSTEPLTLISGTQLLLLASNETDVVKDSSSASRTPTNTGVTYSASTPFT